MADSDLVIPNEIGKIVNERATLWQRFEESQNQFNEIEKLASQVASSTPTQIPSELTSEKTPPAEITVALQNLQAELAKTSEAQRNINAYEDEIRKIEDARMTTIVAIVVIVIIVIVIVLYNMSPH